MNLNIIAYGIFMAIVAYIIIVVGRICYRNGNIYVLSLMPGHEELCLRINKILLLGYYLINIGYTLMMLVSWQKVTTVALLIETTMMKTAIIISVLSILHYTNIFVLTKYSKKLIQQLNQ
ncbi:hypothetical protein AMR72_13340 [Flavobacterium psychrophilum]|nr:hypothetical protein AMR72_13340 [Flavobacterium psychrophilum]AOE53417.1 hypothetical protein ALW18_13330 [Flavobacterium psychrophilum]